MLELNERLSDINLEYRLSWLCDTYTHIHKSKEFICSGNKGSIRVISVLVKYDS